ncbi:unnamed protein product [Sphenostylis stenocarpa]|uniref:Amino acid transporter transmembrane domain-containing protein n=1 Tax=Sphenostylis stenocarpa TaxID=92480 RepID=A0AA86SYX8_9FABA|nr:unnamed protein product [Sphenostylis stenocarpa]
MQPVIRASLVLCSSIYILTALFGFLLFGESTLDDVLANFDTDLGIPYSSLLNDIVRISYALHLMLGALRNAIATFIQVSPILKDSIWTYLEQYDLPVVVGPDIQNNPQSMGTQVYDMQFELNEIEARREQYPSTISFLNLVNALIAEESDLSDRGRRILSMYDIKDEDYEGVVDQSRLSTTKESSPLQTQLPVLELLKDFMSGKTAFRNIMSILLPGVNSVIAERSSQLYGQLLENAVQLALEIMILWT